MKIRRRKHSLTLAIILAVVSLIILVQSGTILLTYYEFSHTLKQHYQSTANNVVRAALNTVDVNKLDKYLETKKKDSGYLYTESRLQNLADSSGSFAIYVAKIDEAKEHRTFVFDVVGEKSNFERYPIGFKNTIDDNFAKTYSNLLQNPDFAHNTVYKKSRSLGNYSTTMLPVINKKGDIVAICSVVMPLKDIESSKFSYLLQNLLWAITLSFIVVSCWIVFIKKSLIKPIRQIKEEAWRFSNQGTLPDQTLTSTLVSNQELEQLAESIDYMEETIISNTQKLLDITAEKNRISAELNVATQIQMESLPQIKESFPARPEMDVAATMEPAKEVGGDFYDFFFIDDDHFALVIADVSGKGIPAALFMMNSKVLIKTECMNGQCDPGEVLTRVNQKLCENNQVDMFVTVWLGILELSTGIVWAANAGHEYPVITGKDGYFEIMKDRHGFVLGGMDGIKERTYQFQLNAGDVLFLYTDGVAEAINHEKSQYGLDRLLEALNSDKSACSETLINNVITSLDEFVGDEEQFDDTTILCVRYLGT